MISPLVSSEWLHANSNNPDLIILDASPETKMSGDASAFVNIKIKGARYFDLSRKFSVQNAEFPNTFPSPKQFEVESRNLGINSTSILVIYDNSGIYTSPRAWWMFKAMGHEQVFVLDGGLPDWISKGFETAEAYDAVVEIGNFKSTFHPDRVKEILEIEANLDDQRQLLIDARSAGRFNGTEKEPRAGLRSGHIPYSINVPFEDVLENGKYKSKWELKEIFQQHGINDKPLIFSCGSGVTACIVLLAAEMTLRNRTAIYDGSWTEWATIKKS